MNFANLSFFTIVIFTIALYYILPKKYCWYILLLSSGYFYLTVAGRRASLAAAVTIFIAYMAALWMEKEGRENNGRKKLYLAVAVIAILSILAVFKLQRYSVFHVSGLIVPLGISYYTFSLIGYLVDVYAKKENAEKNILKVVLYTLYFPKIVQGPISKFREIGPKLTEGHSFEWENFCFGLQRIIWGYFKKLVITERASALIDNVFGNFPNFAGGGAVLSVTTFIAVISHYCDFSGYMDIVIGISQCMGIGLDENFRQPFFSKTAAEFWRRWHITLGIWFKDYVYMPLVINPFIIKCGKWVRDHIGKRAGKAVLTMIPLISVWFLTGLWHGTGLNYILWGLYWGFIIIFSNVFTPEIKKITKFFRINTDAADWKVFQTVRTFCIFAGGFLLSTLVGYQNMRVYAWCIIKKFEFGRLKEETFAALGLDHTNLVILVWAIILLWIVEACREKGSIRMKIAELNPPCRWIIYALSLLAVIMLGVYGPGYSVDGFAYAFF